jgi:cation:H+ antiporter
MSKALIGVTLIGFGTSMPEFVATFGAAAKGSPDIAFGNVMGSNISNILMILGAATLISPILTNMKGLARDALFVSFGSLAAFYWIYTGGISQIGGVILIAAFIIYMTLTIRADLRATPDEAPSENILNAISIPLSLFYAIGGIVVLVLGAEALIRGASDIARGFGVSEAIIGITIVGIGTSLPEAVAAIISSLKGENELAFANIIGSNIFNGLGILGVTAVAYPMQFGVGGFSILDGVILCAATAAMFIMATSQKKIERWEGAVLLFAYASYLFWLVLRAIG